MQTGNPPPPPPPPPAIPTRSACPKVHRGKPGTLLLLLLLLLLRLFPHSGLALKCSGQAGNPPPPPPSPPQPSPPAIPSMLVCPKMHQGILGTLLVVLRLHILAILLLLLLQWLILQGGLAPKCTGELLLLLLLLLLCVWLFPQCGDAPKCTGANREPCSQSAPGQTGKPPAALAMWMCLKVHRATWEPSSSSSSQNVGLSQRAPGQTAYPKSFSERATLAPTSSRTCLVLASA